MSEPEITSKGTRPTPALLRPNRKMPIRARFMRNQN